MLAFEEAQAACERAPGCEPSELKPDHTQSRRWQGQSVRLCEELLKSAPNYARADEALYLLGITHLALGEVEGTLKHLTALVKTHPSSPRAPDAYVLPIADTFHTSVEEETLLCNRFVDLILTKELENSLCALVQILSSRVIHAQASCGSQPWAALG